MYPGNNDLSSLLINYLKCNCIAKGGCGANPIEFFKSDPINQGLLTTIGKISQNGIQEFFEERKKTENLFDEAVKNF